MYVNNIRLLSTFEDAELLVDILTRGAGGRTRCKTVIRLLLFGRHHITPLLSNSLEYNELQYFHRQYKWGMTVTTNNLFY